MNIFGINGGELIVLVVLALLLLGPEKIPEYLRTLREWIHKARKLAEGAKEQFKEETGTDFDEVDWQKYDPRQYDPRRVMREALAEPIEDLEASLKDAKNTVQDAADTVVDKPKRPELTQAEIIAAAVPIDQLDQQANLDQQAHFPDPSRPELSNGSSPAPQQPINAHAVTPPAESHPAATASQPEIAPTDGPIQQHAVVPEPAPEPLTTPFDAEAT